MEMRVQPRQVLILEQIKRKGLIEQRIILIKLFWLKIRDQKLTINQKWRMKSLLICRIELMQKVKLSLIEIIHNLWMIITKFCNFPKDKEIQGKLFWQGKIYSSLKAGEVKFWEGLKKTIFRLIVLIQSIFAHYFMT